MLPAGAGMHIGVACQRPDLTVSVRSWNRKHISVHSWKWKLVSVHTWNRKLVSVHSWKRTIGSVHSWKPVLVHSWKRTDGSVHSRKWKHVSVSSWKQKHVSQSISSSIFVSSGYGARLLMERAEVVGGLPAAVGAMSYQRPRAQLPRWAGCAVAELH